MKLVTVIGIGLVLAGMTGMIYESVAFISAAADGNGDGPARAENGGRGEIALLPLLAVLAFFAGIILIVIGARRSRV